MTEESHKVTAAIGLPIATALSFAAIGFSLTRAVEGEVPGVVSGGCRTLRDDVAAHLPARLAAKGCQVESSASVAVSCAMATRTVGCMVDSMRR